MRAILTAAARAMVCDSSATWVILHEHQVHGRIPDLVLGRLHEKALTRRLASDSWRRALTEVELRALRGLRPDRARSLVSLASDMHVGERRAQDVVRALLRDGFIERTSGGLFVRVAPVRPIFDRIVSFEAKRSDLRRAYVQARAHTMFADHSFVAFDLAYLARATTAREIYRSGGIGMVGLRTDSSWCVLERPRKSMLRAAIGQALAAERALARLLGTQINSLPESRLPHGSRATESPAAPELVGPRATALWPLIAGHE
jgi:hypothetical protein